jgi:hypothetical protein
MSEYFIGEAGTFEIKIYNQDKLVIDKKINLESNQIYTLILSGDKTQNNNLSLNLLSDNNLDKLNFKSKANQANNNCLIRFINLVNNFKELDINLNNTSFKNLAYNNFLSEYQDFKINLSQDNLITIFDQANNKKILEDKKIFLEPNKIYSCYILKSQDANLNNKNKFQINIANHLEGASYLK